MESERALLVKLCDDTVSKWLQASFSIGAYCSLFIAILNSNGVHLNRITYICGPEEPGIELPTFRLVDDPLYRLSRSYEY